MAEDTVCSGFLPTLSTSLLAVEETDITHVSFSEDKNRSRVPGIIAQIKQENISVPMRCFKNNSFKTGAKF